MFHTKLLSLRICAVILTVSATLLLNVRFGLAQASDSKSPAAGKALADLKPPIRIRAGAEKPFKDSKGNEWLADASLKEYGFEGGDTIERPGLKIENTKDAEIYWSERYSMDSFTWKIPNGKYDVKLHFAETYDGIGGPGDRVFSFKVQDKEFKDFDVWKKSGGFQKAYVETVPVEVTDGKLKVTFTPKVQNPQINGIEILPPDNESKGANVGEKASTEKPATTGKSAASAKSASNK